MSATTSLEPRAKFGCAPERGASPAAAGGPEDCVLVDACKRGSRTAWDRLIRRYQGPVYRFAYGLSRNHDDASDIAAQAFIRVFQGIQTFRNDSHFASWLFCIARNVYIDTCVRSPHRGSVSLDAGIDVDGHTIEWEIVDPSPSPEQRSLFVERRDVLLNAIRHLPQYQRRMMEMYHSEGRSYEEIAAETGLSLGTVKSRLARARRMLRSRLEPMQEVLLAA